MISQEKLIHTIIETEERRRHPRINIESQTVTAVFTSIHHGQLLMFVGQIFDISQNGAFILPISNIFGETTRLELPVKASIFMILDVPLYATWKEFDAFQNISYFPSERIVLDGEVKRIEIGDSGILYGIQFRERTIAKRMFRLLKKCTKGSALVERS